VQLFWQDSDALVVNRRVLVRVDQTATWQQVANVRRANRHVLVHLAGVDTMDAAAKLRGALLLVSRADLPPLQPDEYYLVDLIGARVEHDHHSVGVVIEVRPYATVDTLVIETSDGRRLEQPVMDRWIQRVDVAEGRVVLASTEGLIE